MPSKSTPFTPSSILFRPRTRNQQSGISNQNTCAVADASFLITDYRPLVPEMVEAPGTAPGSEWFIAAAIYRHSRQAGVPNIGVKGPTRKSRRAVLRTSPGRAPDRGPSEPALALRR
jgi:hypothetical protein